MSQLDPRIQVYLFDYSILCKYMLTAPLTSVKCERGFSTQNRLKVKAMSSLNQNYERGKQCRCY
jgi:hypothetical protein